VTIRGPASRSPSRTGGRDSVDRGLSAWLDELADVNPGIEAARQRLRRLARQLDRSLAEVAKAHGMSVGDWEALSVLRRSGPPYELSPTALARELEITTGTMSLRLERLSHAALIVRTASPTDGRSHAVRLTETGHERWRTATAERIHRERQLVGGPLTTSELEQLNRLLRKLMLSVEDALGPAPRHEPAPDPAD